MNIVWKKSLFMCLIGLFTRVSTLAACLLGFYLLGLPFNFGKIDHYHQHLAMMLLVFCFSHCGDSLSLDRFIRYRRGVAQQLKPSGEYTWPIRLMQVLIVVVMFAAGIGKFWRSGLGWIFSDNMANLLVSRYYTTMPPSTSISMFIAEHPWLYKSFAAAAILLETLSPLLLFSRYARLLILPGLFIMITCFPFLLGFGYTALYCLFIFWVPWDQFMRWLFLGVPRNALSRDVNQ